MTYALVIIVIGINATALAITNIPGFNERNAYLSQGKALSDAVSSQGTSDFGKVITFCIEVR